MARHTFHLTPHASTRLYQFVSSPTPRVIQLCLTLFAIFFFSIGVGLADKYIKPTPYWDLGSTNDFAEKLALGMTFLPFGWLVFLLTWHVFKKPKLHPGYYIGFGLYIALSILIVMPFMLVFSSPVMDSPSNVCEGWGYWNRVNEPALANCMQHVPAIRGIDITAYAFAIAVGLVEFVFFCVACRVCAIYDHQKRANKKLGKKGVELASQRTSEEHIV
ncbi:MAG: hypothetical protein Q9209_001348 [Squamulea sp. 1 TL-2023]